MVLRTARWILLAGVFSGITACNLYWGAEVEGRVVDAQTGAAIEGATVAIVWPIYGGLAHGNTVGNLLAQEATTDAYGKFSLPSWGPKFVFWNGLHVSAPTLVIGHRDYYFEIRSHQSPSGSIAPPSFSIETRDCDCGEKEIPLRKLGGDWEQFRQNAEMAERNLPLDWGMPGFLCVWVDVPKFAGEILRRSAQLSEQKIVHSLPTVQQLESQVRCGGQSPTSGE